VLGRGCERGDKRDVCVARGGGGSSVEGLAQKK